jgi:Protein of unknown function (DUF2652)
MNNQGLLFIPDISGFTRFVNETEIDHSRLIIQELLEILVNANLLGLEISEIEGDAILFYRFGSPPELKDLYEQVEKMFLEFHRNIVAYERRRYCQCKACLSAINLTLKVITHYGEFTDYKVKDFKKLIGRDLIVAHQLLKNDIPRDEYWLVTENLLTSEPQSFKDLKWVSSMKQTESGVIPFQYAELGQLKNNIQPEVNYQSQFDKMSKMFSLRREFGTDIITLFHATGDFQYRSRWVENVKGVEELTHYLPRVGMKCKVVTENGTLMIYSNNFSYTDNKIEFSEQDENKNTGLRYTLERIGPKRTSLTLDYYIENDFVNQLSFRILKKRKIKGLYERSIKNLDSLIAQLKIPTAVLT